MKLQGMRQKKGFTLVEIIIVVVILGVLAAIAIPKVTGNVNRSRAAESFNVGSTVAAAFNRCVDAQTGGLVPATNVHVVACRTWAALGVTDPSDNSQSFDYTFDTPAAGTVLTLTAAGKFTGFTATDLITFAMNGGTGGVVKGCGASAATDIFFSMCQN